MERREGVKRKSHVKSSSKIETARSITPATQASKTMISASPLLFILKVFNSRRRGARIQSCKTAGLHFLHITRYLDRLEFLKVKDNGM